MTLRSTPRHIDSESVSPRNQLLALVAAAGISFAPNMAQAGLPGTNDETDTSDTTSDEGVYGPELPPTLETAPTPEVEVTTSTDGRTAEVTVDASSLMCPTKEQLCPKKKWTKADAERRKKWLEQFAANAVAEANRNMPQVSNTAPQKPTNVRVIVTGSEGLSDEDLAVIGAMIKKGFEEMNEENQKRFAGCSLSVLGTATVGTKAPENTTDAGVGIGGGKIGGECAIDISRKDTEARTQLFGNVRLGLRGVWGNSTDGLPGTGDRRVGPMVDANLGFSFNHGERTNDDGEKKPRIFHPRLNVGGQYNGGFGLKGGVGAAIDLGPRTSILAEIAATQLNTDVVADRRPSEPEVRLNSPAAAEFNLGVQIKLGKLKEDKKKK